MKEGTCIEGNRSLSQSLEGWEKEPGRLCCCFMCTPVSTVQLDRDECMTIGARGDLGGRFREL